MRPLQEQVIFYFFVFFFNKKATSWDRTLIKKRQSLREVTVFWCLVLCERINQQLEISADGIQNWAGAPALGVFRYFGAGFCRGA